MYLEFFGLREKPFSQTPDPRFLYWNDSYREAFASLRYGIQERKGFLTFIGEAGTGKTTLLRKLLEELGPDVLPVFLFNPDVGFEEILQYTLGELGIACPTQRRLDMLQRLNEFLLSAYSEGRNTVLLIDEAQDLDSGVLESLRLLSNLETTRDKILQIVLCGQPELARRLAQPNLRQLKQRIAVRCRLEPLRRAEIPDYLSTRTRIAGAPGTIFDESCIPAIWDFSGGIPRLVNMACDNALLVAYAVGKRTVDASVLEEVVHDLSRLDVMDLSEDFIDPLPSTRSQPTEGPGRSEDGLAPSRGVRVAPPPPVPMPPAETVAAVLPGSNPRPLPDTPAPAPAPSAAAHAATAPARSPDDGVPRLSPREPESDHRRTDATRWLPWVAVGGVLLGALGASVVSRRSGSGDDPQVPVLASPVPRTAAPASAPEPAPPASAAPVDRRPASSDPPAAPTADSGAAAIDETPRPAATLGTAAVPSTSAEATAVPTIAVPTPAPRAPEASPPLPSAPVESTGASLGPLENRRAVVRRGDTLSHLATEVYGTESLTLLDVLGRSNPGLSDLDHIEPGQSVFFPEPRPETRVFGQGDRATVLVATSRDRVVAERVRRALPPGLLGLSTVEPGRLGSLRVYRVVVRDLGTEAAAREAADRLGPVIDAETP